jgi:hypothetical protein
MKPRIRRRYGIWGCMSGTCWADCVIGYGYTPAEAYADWKALQ